MKKRIPTPAGTKFLSPAGDIFPRRARVLDLVPPRPDQTFDTMRSSDRGRVTNLRVIFLLKIRDPTQPLVFSPMPLRFIQPRNSPYFHSATETRFVQDQFSRNAGLTTHDVSELAVGPILTFEPRQSMQFLRKVPGVPIDAETRLW